MRYAAALATVVKVTETESPVPTAATDDAAEIRPMTPSVPMGWILYLISTPSAMSAASHREPAAASLTLTLGASGALRASSS
jgi:hypothetical protein